MYEEPKGRVRWLTVEQVQALLKELLEPQRAMGLFDLCVGLREANIRLLEWEWIDFERKVMTVGRITSRERSGSA